MTTPVVEKKVDKTRVAKRALIQLRVTGFQGVFPRAANLATAVQQRAAALGYENVGEVTIDSASTDNMKLVNIAATEIEPVRLVGILDDVLKTFLGGGYTIELNNVTGAVTAEMKLSRLTKKQYKEFVAKAKTADTTKAAVAASTKTAAVVKTANKAATVKTKRAFLGRRTGAFRKIARNYTMRSVSPSGGGPNGETQTREYTASGTTGITAAEEAAVIARFLFAAFGLNAVATDAKIVVTGPASASVPELDSLVGNIVAQKVVATFNDDNANIIDNWMSYHPGVYVDSMTANDGYIFVGPKELVVDLPALK